MIYPSGMWIGFWEQHAVGRHPMREFELHFRTDGTLHGSGTDLVGPFTITGTWQPTTGAIAMVKQYLRKHRVEYAGLPDGEGSILGTWRLSVGTYADSGPFGLSPHHTRPTGSEPIREIGSS